MLNVLVKDFEKQQEEFEYSHNCCLKMFDRLVTEEEVDVDTYMFAKSFTSIVNQIVNRKAEYICYLTANQIELLSFLNTYDDKYLSNMSNLFSTVSLTEKATVEELKEDIDKLLSFLEDFLIEITN